MCVCDDAAARPPDGNACRTQCEGLVENDNCYMHGVVGSGTYRQTMGREASPHAAAKAVTRHTWNSTDRAGNWGHSKENDTTH
eukprot:1196177-Prorocentrum_minimum.AAC.1